MKTLEEQIGGRCKHFNGIQNKTCSVGICYDQFSGPPPCLKSTTGAGECNKREWPSAKEIAKEIAEIQKSEERLLKLDPLICQLKTKPKDESWCGTVPCPVCGKKLQVAIAACNGHTRGACATKGCLSWVE